jgi:integrase
MAFGKAKYENIIQDNFIEGHNRVEKLKSNFVKNERIAFTIEEQKILANYLTTIDYNQCRHKYLLLLLLSTGMRIGEALALDYENDIDLKEGTITIRRTITKDKSGKYIIGQTTKTSNGIRILHLNDISKQILQDAYDHKVPNKEHLLFCSENKTLYAPNTINSFLKRLAINLNLGVYEEKNKNGMVVKKQMSILIC